MAIWKDTPQTSTPPPASPRPAPQAEKSTVAALNPEPNRAKERAELRESVIASGLHFEGKIEGAGHVRISGRFKGDVHIEGDLTIEPGAQLAGQVRAGTVSVAGELQGNIESARRVELAEGGIITGDVKAGALTVAAGSRMRGQVEFGFEEKVAKAHGEARGLGSGA